MRSHFFLLRELTAKRLASKNQILSISAAMPCPTPMHMVVSA
jgi:hypothetical protein